MKWLFLIVSLAWLAWACNPKQNQEQANSLSIKQQLHIADSLFEKSGTQAIPNYRTLYHQLEAVKPKDRILVVCRLAECWHDKGQYDSAHALLNQVLQAETIIKDSVSLLTIRLTKAQLHQDLEQVDSAEANYLKCLNIAEKLKLRELRFKATFGLANAYSSQNKIGQSQQLYFKLIPEAIELKDSSNLAFIHQNIAFNYQLKGKNKDAIRYYLLAKEYLANKPSSLAYAEILNNLGTCYSASNILDSALNNYIASELIFRMKNNKTGIMRSVFNQANIKQKQGKLKEAESDYFRILKDARLFQIKIAEGYVLSELAMIRFRQKNYKEAVKLIDSSFNFLINNDIVARGHQILDNREEIITNAVGKNKNHHWWKEQEAMRAQINNPSEDSLLVNSESVGPNRLKFAQVKTNKKQPWDKFLIPLLALFAVSLLVVFFVLPRLMANKNTKQEVNPEQLAQQALALENRLLYLLEKDKKWKSAKFTSHTFAQEIGIPKLHLEAVIQHLWGISIERLILQYRVNYASELLDDPASAWMNSEQIAASCGFNSVTSFYKGFVAITGMQPIDYQKRQR